MLKGFRAVVKVLAMLCHCLIKNDQMRDRVRLCLAAAVAALVTAVALVAAVVALLVEAGTSDSYIYQLMPS